MPFSLTIADVRTHVETDLTDPAVQRIIDDALSAIVRRYGTHAGDGDITVQLFGNDRLLYLERPIAAGVLTTVTEWIGSFIGETSQVLVANDYRVWNDGLTLERLASGTTRRDWWGDRVVLVYPPANDDAARKMLAIDLAKLAIQYEAAQATTFGDVSVTHLDYAAEREKILGRLEPAISFA